MAEQAKIPSYLQPCKILKTHDDGDITIECRGERYVVTTDSKVFKEYSVEQCMLDEIERPSEEWLKMSKEEKREAFKKAMTSCVRPFLEK